MPNCARIKPSAYKVCTGDLRSFITIKKRTKASTNTTAVDPLANLTTVETAWAYAKSVNGEEIFDGVNMVGKITNWFYMRYNPDIKITKGYIVEYDGYRYEIIEIIPNLEGRYTFTALKCTIRGLDTLENTKL